MTGDRIKNIVLTAATAQLLGTIIAFVAAIYLVGDLLYRQSESMKSGPQSEPVMSMLVYIIGAPPLIVAFAAGLYLLILAHGKPKEKKVKMSIKLILFADPILLFFLVYATGGVEQNIFSPIFFLIPVCSVALLKHWTKEKRTVAALVVVTVACHLMSAWLNNVLPIAPRFRCAPFATWICLYVCVALSAWTGAQTLNNTNTDDSRSASEEEN